MMIDNKPNEYGSDGNSTDFKMCAEGWRLYWKFIFTGHEALAAKVKRGERSKEKDAKTMGAWIAYRDHVRSCPECIAMTGRFEEEDESES